VKEIRPGLGSFFIFGLVSLGGFAYFAADNGEHGSEL
jgi:hypothetical protein